MSEQKKPERRVRIPITGCLEVLLLLALCGIAINECQRSQIRKRIDKIRYEYVIDSIRDERRQLR